jgi:hypothetical protein
MKVGKKILENRIEEFCRASSQLLNSIHTRCGEIEEVQGNGQTKRGRKKRAKKK